MKKAFIILTLFVAGTLSMSSCNKKLKKDMKEMEAEMAALQTSNAQLQVSQTQLQNQANQTNAILGANEPIIVTTVFVDDYDSSRTITEGYYFKGSDDQTQYINDNQNGTFDVYVERFSDVDWNYGAWFEFTYDSTTKVMTNKRGGHYWDNNNSPYGSNANYNQNYTPTPVINITLNKINVLTGDLDMNFSASANAAYGTSYSWAMPNPNKSNTTTFAFKGKLKYRSGL